MQTNSAPTLRKFIVCPEQKRKNFDLINLKRKKIKRNKSELLPQLYASLSDEEKTKVKYSMVAYNNIYSDQAFYEPEEYYQIIYRQAKQLTEGSL